MVCSRCKMVVKAELEKLGFSLFSVEFGEVVTVEPITEFQKKEIDEHLKSFGFELINNKKNKTISKIKTLIIYLVHNKNNQINTNLSDYLVSYIHQDYNTLSNLFSQVENTTIEKYFIHQKIEKVKELLMYDEMNLSEIAFLLHYSSVGHLSNQFKKATGFSPSCFKHLNQTKRKQIDQL